MAYGAGINKNLSKSRHAGFIRRCPTRHAEMAAAWRIAYGEMRVVKVPAEGLEIMAPSSSNHPSGREARRRGGAVPRLGGGTVKCEVSRRLCFQARERLRAVDTSDI